MRNRTALALTAAIASLLLLPAASLAQNPWDPIEPSASLITDGLVTRSPIALPFPLTNERAIPPSVQGRSGMDYEQIYAVPFTEIDAMLRDPKRQQDGFAIVNAEVFPEARGLLFKIAGRTDQPDGTTLRFYNKQFPRDITVHLKDRGEQTAAVFENVVITRLASGIVPARVGFLPTHLSGPVPFRWN